LRGGPAIICARRVKHRRNSEYFPCQGCLQLFCSIARRYRNGFAALRGGPAMVLLCCTVRESCNAVACGFDCEGVLQCRNDSCLQALQHVWIFGQTPVWDFGAKKRNMFGYSG